MKNRIVLFEVLLLCGIGAAAAQPISVGVKAGVPFMDATIQSHDESRPFLIGPYAEVRLPAGFAIEADALYHRIGNTTNFNFQIPAGGALIGPGFTYFNNRVRGNSWEFPVIGKYYFRRGSQFQPFVGTGWELRTVSFHSDTNETRVDGNGVARQFSFHNDYRSDVGVGAVVAAGVRYRAGRLAIVPEVRYTRWGNSYNMLRPNQAGFFLGVGF